MLEVRVKRKLAGFTLDVAFSVNQEILAILGPSGSGKTMTLRCIAGLTQPDEGYIKLNDKVLLDTSAGINLPPQMRKVGFIFQNYSLFPHLTVNQNIAYGISHLPARQKKERVSELLEKMNIQQLGNRTPRQLSAGQQQRVAVARALAPEPEILLLDEPFSALDSLVKERLHLVLQSVQQFYKGNMLFVTHDLTEGFKLSSKIAVFESGQIVQHDYKEKVIFCPSNRTVARLVGFKNLMKGFISTADKSMALIKVPELGGFVRAVVPQNLSLAPGQRVTVGIRPECLQLRDQPGDNTFSCSMNRAVEGVTSTDCYFYVNGVGETSHYLMAILPRSHTSLISTEHANLLYFPPEHVVIIPD
jgi:molybdate transport system ATP-binding protein